MTERGTTTIVTEREATTTPTKRAGLFDLRWMIALLFGIYGVVLTVVGLAFTTPADLDKAGGININLWAGLAMAAFALLIAAWAQFRPITVPADKGSAPTGGATGAGEQ